MNDLKHKNVYRTTKITFEHVVVVFTNDSGEVLSAHAYTRPQNDTILLSPFSVKIGSEQYFDNEVIRMNENDCPLYYR